jgi:hypothetical protein
LKENEGRKDYVYRKSQTKDNKTKHKRHSNPIEKQSLMANKVMAK